MKTKVMASVLAGVMGVQSTAMATSRVDAIGNAQIAQGAKELADLDNNLRDLDKTLELTAQRIELKKTNLESGIAARILDKGSYGLAMGGAAVGLVAGVISTAKTGGGVGGLVMGTVGNGLTFVSALLNIGTHANDSFDRVDVEEAREKVTVAQAAMEDALKTTADAIKTTEDVILRQKLIELETSLNKVSASLEEYESQEDLGLFARIGTEITQASGVVLMVYGMTAPGGGSEKALKVGALAATIGNILTVADLASNDELDAVLGKIAKTRLALSGVLE